MRINKDVRAALDGCGLPYSLECGTRHIKIKVGDRLAGILPLKDHRSHSRAILNTIAQIRRTAKEVRGD